VDQNETLLEKDCGVQESKFGFIWVQSRFIWLRFGFIWVRFGFVF